jgi:hypothetical protein
MLGQCLGGLDKALPIPRNEVFVSEAWTKHFPHLDTIPARILAP